MNPFKTFLEFSKKEQLAILFLLLLLLATTLFSFLAARIARPDIKHATGLSDSITFAMQYLTLKSAEETSAEQKNVRNGKDTYVSDISAFPFNPNQLTEEEWRKLGLKEHQIKNIRNYLNSGARFKSKEDFGKLYTISDEEYALLEPYIIIPLPDATNEADQVAEVSVSAALTEAPPTKQPGPVELNQADSLALISIPSIGPWFAHRILKYRKILGGYTSTHQLLEVHGMDSTRLATMAPFLLIDTLMITKLKVNHLDFKELLRHPYLSFEQVKAIVNHRNRRGFIRDEQQLAEITAMLPEEVNQLRPYLDYE